jgi:hypothetical protein
MALWVLVVAGISLLPLSCGGKSTHERSGRNPGVAGAAGLTGMALGGMSGEAGSGPEANDAGQAGVAGAPALCPLGAARCTSSGVREICASDGWASTDFVCARNVAVDDEIGSYCITKIDGSYRCWGGAPGQALPAERYQRVQLARQGLIGLTEDGRLLARGTNLPSDLQPVKSFRATDMFSEYGVCAVLQDGSFLIFMQNTDDGTTSMRTVEGPFASAFCAWEGLAAGVLEDGSLWTLNPELAPPGNGFEQVALSLGIFCAHRVGGAIDCFPAPFFRASADARGCAESSACPIFPVGRYRSITATAAVACAIDETGSLICKRHDGADVPVAPGQYTFAEGGRDILCAIRVDGSVACFRHGGAGFFSDIGALTPVEPGLDSTW